MRNGKTIVFRSITENIFALDLASGKRTKWPARRFLTEHFAKLGESTLLVDAFVAETSGSQSMVFDIDAGTLAPVTSPAEHFGFLMALEGRAGYVRTRGPELWIGDQVSAGEALPIGPLADAYHRAYQIKIKALNPGRPPDALPPSWRVD